ncbi:MAG: M48 family metallopeptidase [Lachnospiraceae bacterium]
MNNILSVDKNGVTYHLSYTIIRSNRKSIGIEVKPGGEIIVRAPRFISSSRIEQVLDKKAEWILKSYLKLKDSSVKSPDNKNDPRITALTKRYRDAATEYIPKRVAYYQPYTGGTYSRITIRDQKTRWGSCSSNGTLSFNFRLMLAPPRVLDYVVVHELCHLTYMNHSKEFWQAVERVMPDYRIYRDWLKQHGNTLTIN